MQDLAGKNILITGANTGIGRATAEALAPTGARLWLACRSRERAAEVLDTLSDHDVHFLQLDLGDLANVRACAAEYLAQADRSLDVLINNAGLANTGDNTVDGFERMFGVNHLGHFLLTELLLDRVIASAPARIVVVASEAHYGVDGIDWDAIHQPVGVAGLMPAYKVSKFANVVYATELAQRLEGTGVNTYSLHPGVVASDVWRGVPRPVAWLMKRFMISNEQGAETSVYCATSPETADQTGLYYDTCAVKEPNPRTREPAVWADLVTRSRALVGL